MNAAMIGTPTANGNVELPTHAESTARASVLAIRMGTTTTPARRPRRTAAWRLLTQASATKTRNPIATVQGSHVSVGAGTSIHPNEPIISRYQRNVAPNDSCTTSTAEDRKSVV